MNFSPYSGQVLLLAFQGYENDLLGELARQGNRVLWQQERLFLVEGSIRPCLWAQSHWLHPVRVAVASIGEATRTLRSAFPRWALYSIHSHRRCQLILSNLRSIETEKIKFLQPAPYEAHGAWTLEDPHTLWYSTQVVPASPLGEYSFQEDKITPPSRAYLKLWELFTVHGIRPAQGDRVIDMGSCPGGWSWVLQQIGCEVISVDKAPLAPKVAGLPRIQSINKDAFTLKPEDIGPVDWFFSDIICYPEKLFHLVTRWAQSGLCRRFVCSVKFQGSTDFETLEQLLRFPDSRLIHLNANKHEVTWISGVPFPELMR